MKQKKNKLMAKTSYVLIFLLILLSCTEKEVLPEITFLSGNSVVFSAQDTETQKTLKFNATKPWELETITADWFEITPSQGIAGEAVLTIKLTNPNITEARKADVKIVSENIHASFAVIQQEVAVSRVKILSPPDNLEIGGKTKLAFEVTPANATIADVSWSSSNEGVISVDQEGNIEALSSGNSTITLKVNDKTDECVIEVPLPDNVITFQKLSKIENSGVIFQNGAYVVETNFEVEQGNTLLLEDNITVKIKDKVEITIKGMIDFTPQTKAIITGYDDNAHPKSIYLTGDNAGGNIKNVTFIDVPIRIFTGQSLVIADCEFKNIRSNRAALDLGKSQNLKVTNCRFIENNYSAIAGAANAPVPLVFSNNYLYKNSLTARNRPQINVTVGGDGLVEISKNEVIGPAENTTNGGIAVSNLYGLQGSNEVIISENKVSDNRYGITTNGVMSVKITKNELIDNRYEANPMNGGSGISIYNSSGGQKVVISENTIKGHLWGITLIGNPTTGRGPEVNIGNLSEGNNNNMGKNIFDKNGHDGVLYELYNNSPIDVSAVNNSWGAFEQTEANIETVIFHKNDNNALGKVTFMPPFVTK